jgi:hypothetical protein
MDIETKYILNKSRLQHLQRVTRFKLNWLKKHHPEIFEAMNAASDLNDEKHADSQMEIFNTPSLVRIKRDLSIE